MSKSNCSVFYRFRPRVTLGLYFSPDDPRSRSRTHQSYAKDADINNIMGKYKKTGVLGNPSISSQRSARFGDFSDLVDYPTMVSRIQQAQDDFMTLPSEVRAKFNHMVENALDFIADPANADEAVRLGLLPKEVLPVVNAVKDGAVKNEPPKPVTPAS